MATQELMDMLCFIDDRTETARTPEEMEKALFEINEYLSKLEIEKMNSFLLVGAVRYSYRLRHKLPIWPDLVRLVYERLVVLGVDPDKSLLGINPKQYLK